MSYCEYWSTRVVGTWCWGKQLCVCSCVRVLQHGQLIIGCGWTVHTWKDEGTLQILAVGHRHVRRRGQNRVAAKTLMSDLIFWAPTPPSRTTQTSPYILIYYRCYLFSAVGGPLDRSEKRFQTSQTRDFTWRLFEGFNAHLKKHFLESFIIVLRLPQFLLVWKVKVQRKRNRLFIMWRRFFLLCFEAFVFVQMEAKKWCFWKTQETQWSCCKMVYVLF